MKSFTVKTTLQILLLLIIANTKVKAQFYPKQGDSTIYQIYNDFIAGYTDSIKKADTGEGSMSQEFLRWYNFWEPRIAPSGSFKVAAQAFAAYAQNFHQSNNTDSTHKIHAGTGNYCSSNVPLACNCKCKNNITTWEISGGKVIEFCNHQIIR